jgi:uncharacterized protein (TIGR00369 family)
VTLAYPPEHHLLRDLQFSFAHAADRRKGRAWMPIVPEIVNAAGDARTGALAILVDVVGGGLAAAAAHPNWIATADLTLHVVRGARPGSVVEARASVLRAGRTTVVLEVDLVDERGRDLGIATMSFSVLPRRDSNPDVVDDLPPGVRTSMATDARLARPIAEQLGVRVVDAACGIIELPVSAWAQNTMGALQGGVVALVAELAAEQALQTSAGRTVCVNDLQLTYLGFGRVGPVRTSTDVMSDRAARVEIIDAGAEERRMTVASVGSDA